MVRHRLAVIQHAEEVSGNVAATCRYYGITRTTFYRWVRAYEPHPRAPRTQLRTGSGPGATRNTASLRLRSSRHHTGPTVRAATF
ncbi:MAG: helix-turn-helix domain-containing protein [Actinomycetota bacterium]